MDLVDKVLVVAFEVMRSKKKMLSIAKLQNVIPPIRCVTQLKWLECRNSHSILYSWQAVVVVVVNHPNPGQLDNMAKHLDYEEIICYYYYHKIESEEV